MKLLTTFILLTSLTIPAMAEQVGNGIESKNCCHKEGGGCKNSDGSAMPICPTSFGQSRKIERKEARVEKRAARKAAKASKGQKG